MRTFSQQSSHMRAAHFWPLAGLAMALVIASPASGASAFGTAQQAACRVTNALPSGTTNVGSGTLVDVTDDRNRGLVLTCAHLFTEGTGQIVAAFPDGRTHGAVLVAIDRDADLAAIEIAKPQAAAVDVGREIAAGEQLRACGYGSDGVFRCATGPVIGSAQRPGQESVCIRDAVRSGDSGGGVFDSRGRLVAVVWGESGGVTYASAGRPLATFVDRVLGRSASVVYSPLVSGAAAATGACPNGMCPLLRPAPAGSLPAAGRASSEHQPSRTECGCCDDLAAIRTRLDALETGKQDRGVYALQSDLGDFARMQDVTTLDEENRSRHESILARLDNLPASAATAGRIAGLLATTALGVSGPAGWAIVAGASIGGWLLGRRIRRRAARLADKPAAKEATAEAAVPFRGAAQEDVQQPIERDDLEARQLLQLSQLEGRDPLQDALAGRLALDRLDAAAEGDADPAHAAWADELRRELRERFNEIAPAKFVVKAES